MITKVVPERGARVRGLLEYLWGPGKVNEHTDPRIVAAWDSSLVRDASAPVLDGFERGLLAREMESPMRMFGKVLGQHVYHTAVSIHAEDGDLTDAQWAEVAESAAEKLGFTAGPDRAAVPWIAMRHGTSAKGHDHIHFVAILCRESGHVPEIRGDWGKWREVREHYAAKWNLRTGRDRGAGMPGLTQAELQRAEREAAERSAKSGQAPATDPESPRTRLARVVRAAATGARDEAEWLRRMRRAGVLVRPRWGKGGRNEVVGYSVALRPEREGYKPIWFGGGKLARDLTLDRLRELWASPDEDRAADIRREWRPPGWRRLPTGQQLKDRRLRAEAWSEAVGVTSQVRDALNGLDPADAAAWRAVARDAAGVLSGLSARVEWPHRRQLSRAANALSRIAQSERGAPRPPRLSVLGPLAWVARVVGDASLAAHGGAIAVASLVAQIGRVVQDIERAHRAAHREQEAQRAAEAAREMLDFVRAAPTASSQQARRRRAVDEHKARYGQQAAVSVEDERTERRRGGRDERR
ncbi:relaxase/mobilization nuclease domain-containing protein [Saccharopolyspora pogona]|uniref:relaxase/mobilization nuclease domain-containing protein n=1 Tax=Saccharopolyspora pogona TaxID=333966 RepID=UPI0016858B79|nr:hypothetical protein [Saccharopolyspora pogona]